jgi:hypothetical protein
MRRYVPIPDSCSATKGGVRHPGKVRRGFAEEKAVRGLRCRRHRFERRDVFGLGYLVPDHQWSRSCRIASAKPAGGSASSASWGPSRLSNGGRRRWVCGASAAMRPRKGRPYDGKVLVSVDLSKINHKPLPARSPAERGSDRGRGDRVRAAGFEPGQVLRAIQTILN